MNRKLIEWLKNIPEDKRREVQARIQKCTDKEGIVALAEEYNLPVTDEIVESLLEILGDRKILSEEDLNLIAGGTFNGPTSIPHAKSDDGGKSLIC